MEIVATIDDGVMKADEQGRFTGSANVNWRTSVIGRAGCGAAEARTGPSRADLTGEINESDQLVVKMTFQPKDFSGWATCGPAGISTGNLATPDPLTIRVATAGGRSTQAQAVTAKNGSFRGSATIVVTPEQASRTSSKAKIVTSEAVPAVRFGICLKIASCTCGPAVRACKETTGDTCVS